MTTVIEGQTETRQHVVGHLWLYRMDDQDETFCYSLVSYPDSEDEDLVTYWPLNQQPTKQQVWQAADQYWASQDWPAAPAALDLPDDEDPEQDPQPASEELDEGHKARLLETHNRLAMLGDGVSIYGVEHNTFTGESTMTVALSKPNRRVHNLLLTVGHDNWRLRHFNRTGELTVTTGSELATALKAILHLS